MVEPKHIFITGASSGIGKALALHYAAPGVALGLVARREELLKALKAECEAKGAAVFLYPLDVTHRAGMAEAACHFNEAAGGADLVIANAGISVAGHKTQTYYDVDALNRLLEVNLIGAVNTIVPFLKYAVETPRPMHLAAVGSVAGFRSLPGGSYSASKAGLKTMMDTWRLVFRRQDHGGVTPPALRFTTICPGYTESEMTHRDAFAPSRMLPASKAALLIAQALKRGTKTFVFPARYRPATFFLPWIPDALLWLGIRSRMED